MDDLISRSDAIGAVKEERFPIDSDYAEGFMAALDKVEWILKEWLPSAQPDSKELSFTQKKLDTISRQAAIDAHYEYCNKHPDAGFPVWSLKILEDLPSAQPETHEERTKTHSCDCISRQAAMEEISKQQTYKMFEGEDTLYLDANDVGSVLASLPSSQPEHTCVNCGRTANNGGWYADGGTRCPIEEHYALPKDGYCHLWEKRNVTDDDYPERREE